MRRALRRAGEWLLALAGGAAVLAPVVPSAAVAERSDLVLAVLVLVVPLAWLVGDGVLMPLLGAAAAQESRSRRKARDP